MADYKEMYLEMVRVTEDVINRLIQAQLECEEMYIKDGGPNVIVLDQHQREHDRKKQAASLAGSYKTLLRIKHAADMEQELDVQLRGTKAMLKALEAVDVIERLESEALEMGKSRSASGPGEEPAEDRNASLSE